MLRFVKPWERSFAWKAGRLADFYDAEGYVSLETKKGTHLGVSQKPGGILDEMRFLIESFDCSFRESQTGDGSVTTLVLRGGWHEVLRLLGTIGSTRLLNKITSRIRCGLFSKQLNGIGEPIRIVSARRASDDWVAELETSTHTYFCEGFGAHNSVAQHSYLVSKLCPKHGLCGLLHDASEAYLCDISSPVKRSNLFAEYREAERWLQGMIQVNFGIREIEIPKEVKDADHAMGIIEGLSFMPRVDGAFWTDNEDAFHDPPSMVAWSPKVAAAKFLARFNDLMTKK
jgi:hypothetical protein